MRDEVLSWLATQPHPPPEGVILEAFDITAVEADRPCWTFARSVMERLMTKPRASPDGRDGAQAHIIYGDEEWLYKKSTSTR